MEDKTLKNLMDGFAGESQANRKYLAYSKKAEKEGKTNAAKLFQAASDAEALQLRKIFRMLLQGKLTNMKACIPNS